MAKLQEPALKAWAQERAQELGERWEDRKLTKEECNFISFGLEYGYHAGEKEGAMVKAPRVSEGTKIYTIELLQKIAAQVEQAAKNSTGGPISPEHWIELAIVEKLQKGEKNAKTKK